MYTQLLACSLKYFEKGWHLSDEWFFMKFIENMWNKHISVALVVVTCSKVASTKPFAALEAETQTYCKQSSTNISSQEPNKTQYEQYHTRNDIGITSSAETMEIKMTLTNLIVREFSKWFIKLNSFSEAMRKSGFTEWSEWGICPNENHVQMRFRTCLLGRIGGPYCSGLANDTKPCCPYGYYDLQKFGFRSCIKYHHHSTNNTVARKRCAKSNGHLIEITSPEKKDVIKNYVYQLQNLITYQYFHVDGELVNGTWVNRHGVPLDYIPWGDNPYLKPEWIYLGLHPDDFLIYDIQSDYTRQYVCEIDI